jgi:chemotaxis protein CheC
MNVMPLTEDERDALQEVMNIAMGQAGDSLARILDAFVELSVPRIRLVEVKEVGQSIIDMVGNSDEEVTAVRQAFSDHLRGEALVIFGKNGCKDLADLMGYDSELDPQSETELLLDVANVLVGAILNGITETLGTELSFSAPSIMADRVPVDMVLAADNLSWSHALLLEVNYSVENRDFKSHLLMLMAEDAIDTLKKAIEDFIESI